MVSGDPGAVQAIPGSYLGPIIRVRRGQKVRVTFTNDLPGSDQALAVYARYTRRGGLDINPFRSSDECYGRPENIREIRQ